MLDILVLNNSKDGWLIVLPTTIYIMSVSLEEDSLAKYLACTALPHDA